MASRTATALLGLALADALMGCAEDEPGPVAVAEVIEVQEYYYACGNEVLHLPDGWAFYPLLPEEQAEFDDTRYADAWSTIAEYVLALAGPGPGDETGELTIYNDGTAHWLSGSGIEAWLTDEPHEYNWVC